MQKLIKYIFIFLLSIPLYSDTITLNGTIRDFYDYNQNHRKNPDFENHRRIPNGKCNGSWSNATTGLVNNILTNGKPTLRNNGRGEYCGNSFHAITNSNSFSQWYNDVSGINQSKEYNITLTQNGDVYEYENHSFFPNDGQLLGNEGNMGNMWYGGNDHNYHFTYEIKSSFTYQGGETFTFAGDDDVWVFIDGNLVIDIGGIHSSVTETVDLDDDLDLIVGETYDFHFFFAERHVTGSNFRITTSIELETPPIVPVMQPFTCNDTMYFSNAAPLGEGGGEDGRMYLHYIDRNESPFSFNQVEVEGYKDQYNALAFNPIDNFLYATFGNKLLKIDKNGIVDDLGVIKHLNGTNLSDGGSYYSATSDLDGFYYLTHGRTKTIFKIDVNTLMIVEYIELDNNMNAWDMTIDHTGEYIYFMSRILDASGPNQLKKLKLSDKTITDIGLPVDGESSVDTLYSDTTGRLFVLFHNGGFYELDTSSGHRTPISNSPDVAYYNDGAMCPRATVDIPIVTVPIAEYRFDECSWSGTANDIIDSIGNNNAKAEGDANTTSFGVISRSGQFSGDGYVDTGDSFNDIFGADNNEFTITTWINPSTLGDDRTNHRTKNTFIAKASDGANDNLEIGVNPNGTLHLYLDTQPKDKYANFGNAGDISTNSWHFVSVSYKDGVVKVQIDDKVYENSITWKNATKIDNAASSPFTIGSSQNVDNYFTGGIDEVKIFDKSLNNEEINIIKDENGDQREVEVCPARVIAEYRFDECEYFGVENEVKDSIGSNHGKAIDANTDDDAQIKRSALFVDGSIEIEPSFSIANKPFAISFWMNLKNVPESDYMAIISKEVELYLGNDRKISINLKNGSDDLVSSDAINLNEWTHIALSSDGELVKLYIDGSQKASSNDANNSGRDGTNSLIIGKTSWAEAELFDGNIDELKIFDGALSVDMLQNIIAETGSDRENTICLEPIGCSEKAIVIDDTKYVHEVDLATGESTTYTMTDEQVSGASVNGFGYNVKDGYLWGSNQREKGTLVRIGKDENGIYSQEKVGPIVGLPEGKSTYIGDVDNNGHLYLYYKNPSKMFVINLDRNSTDHNYTQLIDSFDMANIKIADMSFNPIDNQLYAIDSKDDFYKIDIENENVKRLKEKVITISNGSYGTSFFDSSGFFYAVKNSAKREIIRVMFKDDENGTSVNASVFSSLINENAQKTNIDGGRCNLNPILIDYGDAPDTYGTTIDKNGARHKLPVNEYTHLAATPLLLLGDEVSSEPDAWITDRDSDDGLVDKFDLLYTSMDEFSVTIKVKNDTEVNANVVAWVDFNGNKTFDEKEGVTSIVMPKREKEVKLVWDVPNDIKKGETYVRFRVSTDPLTTLDTHGVKGDGEVEDYKLDIKEGSVYDAWGATEGSLENSVIHTKIVNQDINLTIASIDRVKLEFKESIFKNIKAGLFIKDGTQISPYQDINLSTPTHQTDLNFPAVSDAHKYVYVKFQFDDDDNITSESNASDPFAIRPNAFDIDIVATTIKAGNDFNISLEANDINGVLVGDSYDENSTVYRIDHNETKVGCIRGDLNKTKGSFVNSEATVLSNYSEVGKINIKVSEVDGVEFAIVDKNDGTGDYRFITEDDINKTISPAKIKAQFTYETINGLDYTYYSNDPTVMGIKLDTNLTVMNESGKKVENFSKSCYAKKVEFEFKYRQTGDQTTPVTNIGTVDAVGKIIKFDIVRDEFITGGVATKNLRLNFGRDQKVVKEPLKFDINTTKAVIEGADVNDTSSLDKSIIFFYARANVPDKSTIGTILDARVHYEAYCKSLDKSNFGLNGRESIDSINWYILPVEDDLTYSSERLLFGNANITASDKDNMTIVSDKTPHKNKIVYSPESYLIYNRTSASTTTHRFNVTFESNSTVWSGKGANPGVNVDQDVSGKGLRKMDW